MKVYIVMDISLEGGDSVLGCYLEEDKAYKSLIPKHCTNSIDQKWLEKQDLSIIKNKVIRGNHLVIETPLITSHHVPVGTYLSIPKR